MICEVFGTFNSSEIAVLWGANQFADVQFIVDRLRYMYFFCEEAEMHEPVFISTYTIVALTGSDFDAQNISGGAMIQLASSTMRSDECAKEYDAPLTYLLDLCKKFAKDQTKVDCCVGEYDYIVESLPPQLKLLTKPTKGGGNGALHIENEFFNKYFSHSTTRLFYREHDIDENLAVMDWDNLVRICIHTPVNGMQSLHTNWVKIKEIAGSPDDEVTCAFNKYRENILEHIQSTSSLGCNLDLLFSDYVQCVNTTPDRQWARDLKTQFSAAIKVFDFLLQSELLENETLSTWYIERIRKVVSVLQQQIRHVSDAGKLFFEEPCSHTESTSQYDLLVHMYYGAVKHILSIIYQSKSDKCFSKQSTLVPLIRFEPVPEIKSHLFFDIPDLNERLVDISIPYDAWCEPGQYIPLLIHELYHYVAPVVRSARNETFAKILLTELNTGAMQEILVQAWNYATRNSIPPLCDIQEVDFNCATVRTIQKVRRECAIYARNIEVSEQLGLRADVQWSIFEEAFNEWCAGSGGYSISDGNYGVFLVGLSEHVCSLLECELSDPKTPETDKILITTLINELSQICAPEDDETRLTLADHIRKVQRDWQPNTVKQLREILPDLGMVQLSGIGVVEYMLIFASFQDKQLMTPAKLRENDLELPFRIGFIFDWLLDSADRSVKHIMEEFEKLRSDFCTRYVEYVKRCSWSCRHADKDLEELGKIMAGQWFSYFKIQFEDYLLNYPVYHDWLKKLATDQFAPLCPSKKSDSLVESLGEYFSALTNHEGPNELFKSNISIVHSFQVQHFLADLKVPSDVILATDTYDYPIQRRPKREHISIQKDLCISRVGNFSTPISKATQQLTSTHHAVFGTDSSKAVFWYRGSQNANFDILPSVMVHFMDKEQMSKDSPKGENAYGTLWEYQRSLLERFKYQADGAPEFINSASYTTSDYLALMQHYGQYTTYLDWSEDVYSSLYFALENEIQMKQGKYGGEDAALYILDPMLYNRARKMLINKTLCEHPEQFCPSDTWYHRQGRRIQEMPDGHIPNLSVAYNKNRYGLFSLDIPDGEDVNLTRKTKYLEADTDPKKATLSQFELEMWNLPLAVYTSRLNPRIRSQSGQFIAYSPFSVPLYRRDGKDCLPPDRFSYLSLMRIQKYFLDCFNEEDPFMYEIKISAFAKNEMGKYLRSVGINMYRIYPELANIKI